MSESGVVSVVIVVRTVRTTASVLTPEPISLRARTERSGRVLHARRACDRHSAAQALLATSRWTLTAASNVVRFVWRRARGSGCWRDACFRG